jgi:hypothetical protein
MPVTTRLSSNGVRRHPRPLARLAAQDGMTIVEVVVTSLMVGLIALTLIGLDAAGKTTADQRRRSQAFSVAQADQERIKGLSGDQIATLNQDRTVTLDGVPYAVNSRGQFLSQSAGSASCSSSGAAADSAKVTSTVGWPANNRAPIVVSSVISPRAGGSLLGKVLDQDAAPLPGVRVTAAGAEQSNSAVRRFGNTDVDGCTIFSVLPVGDYTVTPARSGYVDKDGNAAPTATVTTTAGNTTSVPFTLGQAGRVTAAFSTTIAGTTYTNQQAPSLSWFNAGMATPGVTTPSSPATSIASPQTLFPFMVSVPGNYTNNYTVWAGGCLAAKPPLIGDQRTVTVGPGQSATASGSSAIAMPGMVVSVTYAGSAVKPAHFKLTDSCGQTWSPAVDPASTMPATGWLDLPGQPYGTYSICADYKFNSSGSNTDPNSFRKATLTGRANTSFTAANSSAVAIATTSSTGFC